MAGLVYQLAVNLSEHGAFTVRSNFVGWSHRQVQKFYCSRIIRHFEPKNRFWTGSKWLNEHEFIDESGKIVNSFCNLDLENVIDVENFVYENLTFPSEI